MGPITAVVHFEVPAENVDRFFAFRQDHIKDAVSKQPGLIDGMFYRGIDPDGPFQFINVARWESAGQLASDWADCKAALSAKLREPGRTAQFLETMQTAPADAGAELPYVKRPALIIMGTADADFVDPEAEGRAIVAALPSEIGTLKTIGGAGHYPHAERPDETAALITNFIAEHASA
jgi:pimeloyl-ACP methyl ester carboxylesterase